MFKKKNKFYLTVPSLNFIEFIFDTKTTKNNQKERQLGEVNSI